MNKFKASGLIAVSHLSKLLVNLFIIKQIAVIHGPQGLGFLGNFMTLITLASTLAGGGIISGIIKYVAEYSTDLKRQQTFITNAFIYTLVSSFFVLLVGWYFVGPLTNYVFLNGEFKQFIYFFLIIQFVIGINNFIFGLCNGLRKIETYAFFMVGGNLIAFFISYYAIPHYGFWGAIISIASPAVCVFIPLIAYSCCKKIPIKKNIQWDSFTHDSRLLSKYSLMLLCSAICFPIVEMIIRNIIVHRLDLTAAGYWQAINRLSSAYLSFYSLFLSYYFVPLISASEDKEYIFEQVKKMILFIILLFFPMIILFGILREEVIPFIFSANFLPIANLSLLQMTGDFFRVIGWVIGFVVVAKALSKVYIMSEIVQAIIFIGLSYAELSYTNRLEGIVYAYVSTCVLYCVLSCMVFYYIFRHKQMTCVTGQSQ